MKKIGIVGGVAWRSTVDYYCGDLSSKRRMAPRQEPASRALDTRDKHRIIRPSTRLFPYFGTDDDDESWRQFDEYHRAALKRLEASGADFALIASNSPHHRFAEIVRGVGIPVISILEAVAKESARFGASEVLILGTAQTMKSASVSRMGLRSME